MPFLKDNELLILEIKCLRGIVCFVPFFFVLNVNFSLYLHILFKRDIILKIERMNKGNWGKIRAFFDLQTEDGFTIKGFKLVEGINGLFVGFPSQKGSDDEYHDTVWADRDVKELVNQLAIKTYGQDVMSSSPNMENDGFPPPPDSDEPEVSVAVPFSDDDIPF